MLHIREDKQAGPMWLVRSKIAQAEGRTWDLFYSCQSSALDYSATAPPFVVGLLVS